VAVVPGEETVALKAKLKTDKTRLKKWLYHSYGSGLSGAYTKRGILRSREQVGLMVFVW
jgi:hypothetical protein